MLIACDLPGFFIQFCFQSSTIFVIKIELVVWFDYGGRPLFQELCNHCQELLQFNWFLKKMSCANV